MAGDPESSTELGCAGREGPSQTPARDLNVAHTPASRGVTVFPSHGSLTRLTLDRDTSFPQRGQTPWDRPCQLCPR